jgi:hypothetical protein
MVIVYASKPRIARIQPVEFVAYCFQSCAAAYKSGCLPDDLLEIKPEPEKDGASGEALPSI